MLGNADCLLASGLIVALGISRSMNSAGSWYDGGRRFLRLPKVRVIRPASNLPIHERRVAFFLFCWPTTTTIPIAGIIYLAQADACIAVGFTLPWLSPENF
jgi:hypothetical protein